MKHANKRILTLYVPLLVFFVFLTFPFIWTLITSLKSAKEIYAGITYIDFHATLINYKKILEMPGFVSSLMNSLIVASATTVVTLTVSTLAAYGFSRFNFKGKFGFLSAFLSINMFPTVLLLIPLFSVMRSIGLLNSHLSLILAYATFTIPFAIWLLTAYINDLPKALDEAAVIDGCNRFQAFRLVILPLTVPGLIATGSYIFITAWNEFVFASMLTNSETRTLPVALQSFVGQFDIQWGLLTAGGVVATIPTLLIFMAVQKRLISGMTAGSVK